MSESPSLSKATSQGSESSAASPGSRNRPDASQGFRSQPDIVPVPMIAPGASYPVAAPPQPPAQPPQKKSAPKLLVVSMILCVLALAVLAGILIFVLMRGQDATPAPAPPQISEVESAFTSTKIDPPTLSGYMYISTEGFTDAKLSQYSVGSVTEDPSAKGTFTCEGKAEAEFENEYVEAIIPLTIRLTHAAESTSWVPGGVEKGKPQVIPVSPPDMEAIQANLQNILKDYNQEVANQFVGADVQPEASLNTQGGTIAFHLSKAEGDQVKSCTVNANVSWGDSGWQVKVTEVTGLDQPAEEEQPAEQPSSDEAIEPTPDDSASDPDSGGSNNSGFSELRPTMLLECWSGDLVRVPGTIQVQQNGSVLLRTDDVILVRFNGRDYITTYFEITGSGTWQNGQHVILDGAISATGSNPVAPLVINTSYA